MKNRDTILNEIEEIETRIKYLKSIIIEETVLNSRSVKSNAMYDDLKSILQNELIPSDSSLISVSFIRTEIISKYGIINLSKVFLGKVMKELFGDRVCHRNGKKLYRVKFLKK